MIAKWLCLIGACVHALLALSFLAKRPPDFRRAAKRALFGATLAAMYLVIAHEYKMPYLYAMVILVLAQIALDLWDWRASRATQQV